MPTMPIENSAPTRWNGAGMSGGMSVKRGWKPPALIRKLGLSPNSARNANCPVSEMNSTRESRSTPSSQNFSGSNTTPPAMSICR